MKQLLELDEALVSLNNTLIKDGVKLLFKLEECQGCPSVIIKEVPKRSVFDFKVTAKQQVNLQLKDNTTGEHICDWQETFNDRGLYALEVVKKDSGRLCLLNTLDEGECRLCPIGVLAFTLLIISLLEALFTFGRNKIVRNRRALKRPKLTNDDANVNLSEHHQAVRQASEDVAKPTEHIDDTGQIDEVPLDENNTHTDANELSPDAGPPNGPSRVEIIDNSGFVGMQQKSGRAESLDVFRGLTISGMIFVNYGGAGYSYLEHSVWNGMTIADMVFPFFVFILGFSVPISIRSLMKCNTCWLRILRKIVTRSSLLFFIGLCLNSMALSDGDLKHLRFPGVLQRFGVTYLIVATTYYLSALIEGKQDQSASVSKNNRRLSILASSFETMSSTIWLASYVYFTYFWEYDIGCPVGYTGPGGVSDESRYHNCTGGAASFIDRYLFGEDHLYVDHELKEMYLTSILHDPEGLLGSTTCILLALIGLQCGKILICRKSHQERLRGWLNWIIITGLLSGLVYVIPINKKLWSLTFVSMNAFLAILVFSLIYIAVDVIKICILTTRLLSSAGKNSLFLYIGHSICERIFPWYFAVDENSHLWLLLRLSWATLLWLLIAHWMALRSIFVKI